MIQDHQDPFVWNTDVCQLCEQQIKETRYPCVDCFGSVHYCCPTCQIQDSIFHKQDCVQVFKSVENKTLNIGSMRKKQYQDAQTEKGYIQLAQRVIKDNKHNFEMLDNHMFFIRLPFTTNTKMKADYPIKRVKIDDDEFKQKMTTNCKVFKSVYECFVKHRNLYSDQQFARFVIYPPDMAIAVVNFMPLYDELQKDNLTPDQKEEYIRKVNENKFTEMFNCSCDIHETSKREQNNN